MTNIWRIYVTTFPFLYTLIYLFIILSDSPEKYGGPYCQLIELSPTVSIVEGKMLYLFLCSFFPVYILHLFISNLIFPTTEPEPLS